jgi:F-type H+-transporting ATPase subunit a
MQTIFPQELFRVGPIVFTDTLVVSLVVSLVLVSGGALAVRHPGTRERLSVVYEFLESWIRDMSTADAGKLVPLVLTIWLFLLPANLVGLVPGVGSPTRDLSLTAALAMVAFLGGHVIAFQAHRFSYLKQYLEPNPLLLPFNVMGEVTRTVALALRLFGNELSGHLIIAIVVYLAGLLIPVPLMLLSVLTGVVQAYIFGVLTLVFAASSLEAVQPMAAKAAETENGVDHDRQ